MGYPVVLTPQSQKDLRSIVRFIRRDSPDRAIAFANLLIDRSLSLGPLPEIGRVVPEINDANVREIIHGSYRIIYEFLPGPSTVYILRFWHAARGTPEIASR
jgi:toxin ParE1/3/4